MSVLIDNADSGVALAVVRSLGRKRIDVTAASSSRHALSFYSKYCKHRTLYPPPENNGVEFIQKMLEKVQNRSYDVLFTLGGLEMELISKYRDKFVPNISIPIVDHGTLEKANDKIQTLQIATDIGIPCPKTYFPKKISDVRELKDKLEYPVVIKPRKGEGGKGVTYIKSPNELLQKFNQVRVEYGDAMIQEWIPHCDSYGFAVLFNCDSKPRATFVYRMIREYPINTGVSTLRESVYNLDAVKYGIKLLKTLNWYGIAMVEFVRDCRDGELKLMEINPRFFGSLALSIAAGVDFPYLLYKMVLEGDIKPIFNYKLGVKCRWLLFGDIKYLISALRHNTIKNKIKILANFLQFYEKDLHYDIISLDDPMPAIFKVKNTLYRGIKQYLGL